MEALLALGTAFIVVMVILFIFMVVAMWILFEKAGQPGWAAIIPIYNILIWIKIAGKEWWWIFGILIALIPVVGQILAIVWSVLIWHGISKNFGKDAGYTVGLVLLPFVFVPILAFGNAVYNPVTGQPTQGGSVQEGSPESTTEERPVE